MCFHHAGRSTHAGEQKQRADWPDGWPATGTWGWGGELTAGERKWWAGWQVTDCWELTTREESKQRGVAVDRMEAGRGAAGAATALSPSSPPRLGLAGRHGAEPLGGVKQPAGLAAHARALHRASRTVERGRLPRHAVADALQRARGRASGRQRVSRCIAGRGMRARASPQARHQHTGLQARPPDRQAGMHARVARPRPRPHPPSCWQHPAG